MNPVYPRRNQSGAHELSNTPTVAIVRSLPDQRYPTTPTEPIARLLCNPSRSFQKRWEPISGESQIRMSCIAGGKKPEDGRDRSLT